MGSVGLVTNVARGAIKRCKHRGSHQLPIFTHLFGLWPPPAQPYMSIRLLAPHFCVTHTSEKAETNTASKFSYDMIFEFYSMNLLFYQNFKVR